jgi:hypothetical protein
MKIGNYELMIGCDPEFFLKHRNKHISAHGLVPGTKKAPHRVAHGAVQLDGMAAEFNIDPVDNAKAFNDNIDAVLGALRKIVPGDFDFDYTPLAQFGADYIAAQPEECRILGCDPDYNAYTGKVNPVPNAKQPFRTASGHIHVSWKKVGDAKWADQIDPLEPTHFEACKQLVKTLDAYVGIPCAILEGLEDGGKPAAERRKLYGQAGAFRPKSYGGGWHGVEYRTPSARWLVNQDFRSCMFGNTVEAFRALMSDYDVPDKKWEGYNPKDIINGVDQQEYQEAAMYIVDSEGKEGKIKSPKYYRLLREKKVA